MADSSRHKRNAGWSSQNRRTACRRGVVFLVVATSTLAVTLVWAVMFSAWNVCRPDLDDDVDALTHRCTTVFFYLSMPFGMNEVNARRARLVLRWVTVFGRVYHLGM